MLSAKMAIAQVEMPRPPRCTPRQEERGAGRDQRGVQRVALGVERLRPERAPEPEGERRGDGHGALEPDRAADEVRPAPTASAASSADRPFIRCASVPHGMYENRCEIVT